MLNVNRDYKRNFSRIVLVLFYLAAFETFAQSENRKDSLVPVMCSADSLIGSKIKSGFYFRILEKRDSLDIFYNQIEWIHIDRNNRVRTFLTANFEYCMLEMYFAKKPKQIKRQIKRNKEKFEQLYMECTGGKPYVASKCVDNRININLDEYPGEINAQDVLIFTKNGLIRTFRTDFVCESIEYIYIGK